MKLSTTLALAALMSAGAAFAANTPTATPATSATTANTASKPAKHDVSMHCDRQAREKKLTGEEKDKFLKDCKAGKEAGKAN